MAFIFANATKGISPDDVVRHVHVSRRLLDLRFREVTGTSVQTAIRERRLDAVKKFLIETERPIGEIALLSGYQDANYLKNQFKRAFGVSMRTFRKNQASARQEKASP